MILNYRHPCETVHMQDKILVVGGEDRNQFFSRSLEDRKECLEWTVQIPLDATAFCLSPLHTISIAQCLSGSHPQSGFTVGLAMQQERGLRSCNTFPTQHLVCTACYVFAKKLSEYKEK